MELPTLKATLMNRDGLSSEEVDDMIADAREELMERIENGEYCDDFCEEMFGLEPDYIMDLI